MTIKIGSNIASLNAQRKLGEAEASLSKVFERLSSGQRINRASDDAAGLAIADDLKAKSRIYTQAIRNGNDGISLLNIADSAIDALTSVVVRIRELSEQSANGTYSNKQREALNNEAQQLSDEFTRISRTTTFNGINIFDGSLGSGLRLQLGIGTSESINASIGGAKASGNFSDEYHYDNSNGGSIEMDYGDLNGDGILDLVSAEYTGLVGETVVMLGSGDGSFSEEVSYPTSAGIAYEIKLEDINDDGFLDILALANSGGSAQIQTRFGYGNGSFAEAVVTCFSGTFFYSFDIADLNNDGHLDLVAGGIGQNSFSIKLGSGDGRFVSSSNISTQASNLSQIKIADINSDGILDLLGVGYDANQGLAVTALGTGNATFGALSVYNQESAYTYAMDLNDVNDDGILDLVTTGQADGSTGQATVRLGASNGQFAAATSYTTSLFQSTSVLFGDVDGDGVKDLITLGHEYDPYSYTFVGKTNIRLGSGDGTFGDSQSLLNAAVNTSSLIMADFNNDSVLDLAYSERIGLGFGSIAVRLAQRVDGLSSLQDFSLLTKSDSMQAMGMLDNTLSNLAKQRGTIGASQSRINIAINNLQTNRENINAAESRIRDADIAQESANLIRTQILQQAAASILSQANQQPQLALLLLR